MTTTANRTAYPYTEALEFLNAAGVGDDRALRLLDLLDEDGVRALATLSQCITPGQFTDHLSAQPPADCARSLGLVGYEWFVGAARDELTAAAR